MAVLLTSIEGVEVDHVDSRCERAVIDAIEHIRPNIALYFFLYRNARYIIVYGSLS